MCWKLCCNVKYIRNFYWELERTIDDRPWLQSSWTWCIIESGKTTIHAREKEGARLKLVNKVVKNSDSVRAKTMIGTMMNTL